MVLCAVLMTVSANNIDYTGELDAETGKPVGEKTDEDKTRVRIGGNTIYDKKAKKYIYEVGDGELKLNLPDGAITTQKINIDLPEGVPVKLYRDGNEIPTNELTQISDAGKYVLLFGDAGETSVRFTIVPELTGQISGFQVPEGFHVTKATLNDQPIESVSYIDMIGEGRYEIEYTCPKTEVRHTLSVKIDHTPPTLKLSAVKDGYADGPVDISDLEPGSQISIKLNDSDIRYEKVLTKSGTYHITLADKAGNKKTYDFVIRVYFNFNSYIFFAGVVLVVAGVIIYLIRVKKTLRVR